MTKALSWEEQIEKFKSRGMIVTPDDVEKLKHINYYRLKEFAKPLATITKTDGVIGIDYNKATFKEVLTRYYQDKNLRLYLLHAIEKIEVALKTRVSYVLGRKHDGFGYLNFYLWCNRKKHRKFDIETRQFQIKKKILQGVCRSNNSELHLKGNCDKDGFPSIWLAIDLLTFGDVVKILEIMSEDNLTKVSAYFGCTNVELLSWMNCLNFVRNICAHNSNLIDLKLKTKPKIKKEWADLLFFTGKPGHKKPTDRIAVIIMIVVTLVNKINEKYKWNRIQRGIDRLCNNNDERAHLLGFTSLEVAKDITKLCRK